MEFILSCEICQVDYDETSCVPVVTNCGHSFCLTCIQKICFKTPVCPKCRKEFDKDVNFPINYTLLNLIEECKSKKNLNQNLVFSIQSLKEKLSSRLLVFNRKLGEISAVRKTIENDLKILESLENRDINQDDKKIRAVLNEVENRYQEISLKNLLPFEDADRYSTFSLKKSKSSEALLLELHRNLKNFQRIFTFKYIEKKQRFGELAVRDNKILIHSLSLSEAPSGSKTVPFEDLKEAMEVKVLHSFMELQDKSCLAFTFFIRPPNSKLVPHFFKLCVGESGISYKNSFYFKGEDKYEIIEQEDNTVKDFQALQPQLVMDHQKPHGVIDQQRSQLVIDQQRQLIGVENQMSNVHVNNQRPNICTADHRRPQDVVDFQKPNVPWDKSFNVCDNYRTPKRIKILTMTSILSVDYLKALPSDYYKNIGCSTSCSPNECVVVERPNDGFQVLRVLKAGKYSILGKVYQVDNLINLNYDNPSLCKILDCGLVIIL